MHSCPAAQSFDFEQVALVRPSPAGKQLGSEPLATTRQVGEGRSSTPASASGGSHTGNTSSGKHVDSDAWQSELPLRVGAIPAPCDTSSEMPPSDASTTSGMIIVGVPRLCGPPSPPLPQPAERSGTARRTAAKPMNAAERGNIEAKGNEA